MTENKVIISTIIIIKRKEYQYGRPFTPKAPITCFHVARHPFKCSNYARSDYFLSGTSRFFTLAIYMLNT